MSSTSWGNLQIFSVLQLLSNVSLHFVKHWLKFYRLNIKNSSKMQQTTVVILQKTVTHPRSLTESIKMKLLCQWISRCQQNESFFLYCAKTAWSKCLAISSEWLEFLCSSYNVTDIESLLHQSIIILMITGCFCVRVNTLQMLISRAQGFTFYFVNQEGTYICI